MVSILAPSCTSYLCKLKTPLRARQLFPIHNVLKFLPYHRSPLYFVLNTPRTASEVVPTLVVRPAVKPRASIANMDEFQSLSLAEPNELPSERTERKMVTVRHISQVSPIRGTKSDLVSIGGWKVVTFRGEYKTGELVVYFEVDSFLPATDNRFWEFCTPSRVQKYEGCDGYVVTTMLKQGHVSQGLIFPFNSFPEIQRALAALQKTNASPDEAESKLLAMDFTTVLGIRKFSAVHVDPTTSYGHSPCFFPQPGCDRVQNIILLFDNYGDTVFQVTEKLDGVPMSVYHVDTASQWHKALPRGIDGLVDRPSYGVCGRSKDYMKAGNSIFWKAAREQGIYEKLQRLKLNISIQGELCGSSILKNSMGFPEGKHAFYVFSIWDIDKQAWWGAKRTLQFCDRNGLAHVPVLHRIRLSAFAKDIDELLAKAEGKGVLGKKREGLIFRTMNNSFGFKVIANSWLLTYGKDKVNQW